MLMRVCVLSVLLCVSAKDAPITWPDARHFYVTLTQRWSNELTLHWPVNRYCPQNAILKFFASITKVGDNKFWRNVSGTKEHLHTTLERVEGEYSITAVMKTKFNVNGVSARATIKASAIPSFGSRPLRPVKEISEVPLVGDGPFVVVLRYYATEQCLLIIYGETPSESVTIEAVNVCRGENRSSLAIALPITVLPSDKVNKTRLLKFDLPKDLLEPLPRFNAQAYSLSTKTGFKLDPPCDIYGTLELTSPKTARLIVTFRPPASHPRFIRKFTFIFSHINETIVFEVVDDENLPYHAAANVIGYSKLLLAQRNKTVQFEVRPKGLYEYPGNYTVSAYTNNAASNGAVHAIIMPEFSALQPPYYEVIVSWDSVTAKWSRSQLFQASCAYLVVAVPKDANASRVTLQPQQNQLRVTFNNLTPETNYSIKLQSNCNGSDPFWTNLGDIETNPGVPGVPTNIKLTQIGPQTVNLTWNPPLELPGRHPYYEWSCGLKNSRAKMRGKTEDTFKVLASVGRGILVCTVQAAMKTKIHMDKYGTLSSPVELSIHPTGYGSIPSSSTTLTTLPISTPKWKEEVTTEKTGNTGREEAVSTSARQKVPAETTELTLATAVRTEDSVEQITKPSEYKDSTIPLEQTTEGHVNTTTVLSAVFGCLGAFLLVAILGIILQKWRLKNAAKMFTNPPPANLPPLYS